MKPEKEFYMLPELVQDVLGRLQPLLNGRIVLTNVPVDLPPIELDYMQIDQVLTNLLENAIRYTPKDSPIEVSAQSDGVEVVISVADRGPGIPSGDLDRVFDKFYRVLDKKHNTGHPSGSGLGLAVSKGLVEAIDLGADDYVSKPFGIDEVLARVRVALRHVAQTPVETQPKFRSGPLQVDVALRRACPA